jgi:hypothetical protein
MEEELAGQGEEFNVGAPTFHVKSSKRETYKADWLHRVLAEVFGADFFEPALELLLVSYLRCAIRSLCFLEDRSEHEDGSFDADRKCDGITGPGVYLGRLSICVEVEQSIKRRVAKVADDNLLNPDLELLEDVCQEIVGHRASWLLAIETQSNRVRLKNSDPDWQHHLLAADFAQNDNGHSRGRIQHQASNLNTNLRIFRHGGYSAAAVADRQARPKM